MTEVRSYLRLAGTRTIKYLAISVAASLALAGTEILLSYVLQIAFSMSVAANSRASWLGINSSDSGLIAVCLILLGIFRFFFQHMSQVSSTHAQESVNGRLRLMTITDIIHSQEAPESISDIQSHVTENFQKGAQYVYHIAQLMSCGLQCAVVLGVMLIRNPIESAVALAIFMVGAATLLRMNNSVKQLSAAIPATQRSLLAHVQRNAKNHMLTVLYRAQNQEHEKTRALVAEYYETYIRSSSRAYLGASLAPLLGIAVLAAVYWFSAQFLHAEIAILIPFFYLFVRFSQISAQAIQHVGYLGIFSRQFQNAYKVFDDIFCKGSQNLSELDAEFKQALIYNKGRSKTTLARVASEVPRTQPPAISISGLTVTLPDGRVIIDAMNLQVAPGEHVGIIGPSGSGKTTLLRAMLGLRPPCAGAVTIDGMSSVVAISSGRVVVGYVGVDPFLMEGTLLANLRYGNERELAAADLWQALEDVGLAAFIEDLPMKLATPLGEVGPALSTGQQQRVALARALLRKPQLLILDEATANLDAANEEGIAKLVERLKGRVTVLIVSHRATILRQADAIIELPGGHYYRLSVPT